MIERRARRANRAPRSLLLELDRPIALVIGNPRLPNFCREGVFYQAENLLHGENGEGANTEFVFERLNGAVSTDLLGVAQQFLPVDGDDHPGDPVLAQQAYLFERLVFCPAGGDHIVNQQNPACQDKIFSPDNDLLSRTTLARLSVGLLFFAVVEERRGLARVFLESLAQQRPQGNAFIGWTENIGEVLQNAPLYAFQDRLTIAFFERDQACAIGQRAERDKARADAPAFELKEGV